MIRRPPRSTHCISSAASDVYKRQAELYDPATGGWMLTAPMVAPRLGHTATPLQDGMVLVVGGFALGYDLELPITPRVPVVGVYTRGPSAELYDPMVGMWSSTTNMFWDRAAHTATLLRDGRVLVAGGYDVYTKRPLTVAEVYDPKADNWSITGKMSTGRGLHTATVMQDGAGLVAGGGTLDGTACAASSELYQPTSGTWSPAPVMWTARCRHVAALLLDGTAVVAGGNGRDSSVLAQAEIFRT